MITGKTGYLDFSGANGFKARIPYTQKYDIEGNYSVLEVDGSIYSSLYARVYILEGTISVAGSSVISMAYANGYQVNTNYNTGTWVTIKNSGGSAAGPWESAQIQHDDEGKASVTIAVSLKGYATAYQGNVGDTFTVTGSATVTLATIPRASTIGATDSNIGAVSMIAVNRKSTSFTHSIKYEFGSLSGYITAAGGVSSAEVKLSATSISFTVPTAFYAQIPNAKTGVCKLTVKTYSGSTQIGSDQTAQFTVTAAEAACKPSVSGTVVDSNETTKALTGDETVLVRYKSNALCTITAAAKNSASISSKKIAGTSVTSTLTIEAVEAATVLFAAVDSRGYSNSAAVECTLIPYVKLTSNPACKRSDGTSGAAVLTIKGNYFNGSFGASANSLTVKYRIKAAGGSYGEYTAVTPALSGNTYSLSVSLSGLDYKTEYVIEVVAADALASVTKTVNVGKGIPLADWGESDFAFNVPVNFKAGTSLCVPGYNLLDNSDFRNPVNQRGSTSFQAPKSEYWFDRWVAYGTGSSFALEDGKVVVSSDGTATCGLVQRVSVNSLKSGSKYTLGFKAKVIGAKCYLSYGVNNKDNTASSAALEENVEKIHTFTFTLPEADADSACYNFRIRSSAAEATMEIEWAALYEGEYTAETLPEYQPKGYAAELMECYRYFYKLTNKTTSGLLTASGTELRFGVETPIAMRTTPTLSSFEMSGLRTIANTNIAPAVTDPLVGAVNGNVLALRGTVDLSEYIDSATYINNTPVAAYIGFELSADL